VKPLVGPAALVFLRRDNDGDVDVRVRAGETVRDRACQEQREDRRVGFHGSDEVLDRRRVVRFHVNSLAGPGYARIVSTLAGAEIMDWTLEVVILPVSDIYAAVAFYRDKVGLRWTSTSRTSTCTSSS